MLLIEFSPVRRRMRVQPGNPVTAQNAKFSRCRVVIWGHAFRHIRVQLQR